ncbi:MAG TPA: DUF349 domain-containing protein [Taishania sp.]|nr:DUF349 domain-containing protein [Taishania sp.]HNS41790.1 DUF349 domain-containing protein [Taishania sp.]
MESTAFLEELKALTAQEDVISTGREVNELSARFEDYVLEEERKLQIAQMEAHENDAEIPDNTELRQLKHDFYEELKAYREKRKTLIDAKNAVEHTNLSKKKALINKLRDIIQNEEKIGAAFSALKEIQETWKEIGDIPRDVRHDIQSEYSRLVEDFFYNINIYKELKEHDLKRNLQLKQEVIEKLKQLQNLTSIKEIEADLKALQNEWEDVGPVNNNDWELLKDEYWKNVHACYSKINAHYEDRRAALMKNLEQKQAILKQITERIDQIPASTDVKFWNHETKEILNFQEEWKKVGFGPRKENDEIWTAFRAQCDRFFNLKKEFYSNIQDKFDVIAEKKKEIIAKANELKDSTDWKKTSMQLINLQNRWKELGNAGMRHEQKLWKQFRHACDVFFDNKQKFFSEADAEFESNLAAKNAVIEKIKAYTMPEDKKQVIADLKQFTNEFNTIGKVPMKVKDAVYNAYKAALDVHYNALKLEGEEKNKIMFQARIDTLAGSPDAARLFAREKADIRKKIDLLNHDILQLENNLGFFANSKGADTLKKEVEKKIERAKNEILALRQRIKLIPNE